MIDFPRHLLALTDGQLDSEVAKILRAPEVRRELAALGAEPVGDTPDEFGAFLKADMARWGKIIQEKGLF